MIKNLETVQGDERDIVLLGIGYGPETPDAPSMPMNFGPLNRAGGWRRLNVAITRARREMLIYSSFPSHFIDLNRTSSEALRDLKHFLQFAEQGPRALGQAIAGSLGGYESPFEQAVAEGLRNLGWSTVPQVGVSRYRVDLGIVHPDRPGDYLVGVECDGATYHSAATARDRDKVRESVLRQLGWKLLRVWSTDWWIDRRAALQQLHTRLQALLIERREADQEAERRRLEKEALVPQKVELATELYPASNIKEGIPSEVPQLQPGTLEEGSAEVATLAAIEGSPASIPVPPFQNADLQPAAGNALQQDLYNAVSFDEEKPLLRPDEFFEPHYSSQLTNLIAKIVQQESPVRDDVLVARIARAHGFLRSGIRIRERILSLATTAHHLLMEEGGAMFVWPDPTTPSTWSKARCPATSDDCRSIENIALVELAAGFSHSTSADYVNQVVRNFGIKRLGTQARARLERAHAIYASRSLPEPLTSALAHRPDMDIGA